MNTLPDYDSPTALKLYLEERGLGMQKKFGQNFLVNRSSRTRLVDALGIEKGSTVWEVGPGLGSMTHEILERGAELTAFEIDRGFAAVLRDIFSEYPNFSLIEGDVLKTWEKEFTRAGTPQCLFGNLPYNIAAVILGDFISAGIRFERIVVTVQKEVALRMAAKPDSEDYSSFSVLCQWGYDVKPLMDLAGGSFWPQPNVTSRAVVLAKRSDWPRCSSPKVFLSLLRGLFSSRRKTLRNNFTAWMALRPEFTGFPKEFPEQILVEAGIDPSARAETLKVDDFLRLSDTVVSKWA